MVAGQTQGRRRCSHCSSSVYGAHTLSLSGSPAPHRLSLATSGVVVDSGHSSGAVWTGGGWGTRSPKRQKIETKSENECEYVRVSENVLQPCCGKKELVQVSKSNTEDL